MKNAFRITVVLLLLFVALTLSSCGLFKSITVEDAKANLKAAGYEITVMSGEEYVDSSSEYPTIMSSELETYVYGKKGEDEIQLFFFYYINDASSNYSFMNNSKLLGGQSNELVYFGTRQAIKDAGL